MTHGSLFSGIGACDLAASIMGWENIFQCEIDTFCQKVLKYHFPKTELYADIKETDFTKYRGRIDVMSGGFPCQPFSLAGKRKGTDDNRYLWTEMFRAIREVKPSWVVAENVYGIITQQDGLVFERVQTDLEDEGYEVQPFIIPACVVGAFHRRDRVWFVAKNTECIRCDSNIGKEESENGRFREFSTRDNERICREKGITSNRPNTGVKSLQQRGKDGAFQPKITSNAENTRFSPRFERQRKMQFGRRNERMELFNNWQNFPTQSPVCGRNDDVSYALDGITFPKWRIETIKAYGNAMVVGVVLKIFETIELTEQMTNL